MSNALQTVLIVAAIAAAATTSIAVSWRTRRCLCRRFDAQAAAMRILANPMQPTGPHDPHAPSRPHHK